MNGIFRLIVCVGGEKRMYCPSCGEQATPGLSYCKQCGAELSGKTGMSERSSAFFAAAMVGVFVFGLVAIAGLIAVMKACQLNEGLINGFAGLAFLMMVIIEAIFIRLLLRSTLGKRESSGQARSQRTTNELDVPPQALPAPAMSVTEHTTRTLEPIANENERR
ncbi:MAG: hypothetical protein ACJ74J_21885 [Blastocatellia bacterium]